MDYDEEIIEEKQKENHAEYADDEGVMFRCYRVRKKHRRGAAPRLGRRGRVFSHKQIHTVRGGRKSSRRKQSHRQRQGRRKSVRGRGRSRHRRHSIRGGRQSNRGRRKSRRNNRKKSRRRSTRRH
tara:strand:+ start:1451 stop:1825 length:375 start_codon:yes stop_codon:yes gene_type:complete